MQIAKDDANAAKILLKNNSPRNAIYLTQQAVEKALKHFLSQDWCSFKRYSHLHLRHSFELKTEDKDSIHEKGFLAFIDGVDFDEKENSNIRNLPRHEEFNENKAELISLVSEENIENCADYIDHLIDAMVLLDETRLNIIIEDIEPDKYKIIFKEHNERLEWIVIWRSKYRYPKLAIKNAMTTFCLFMMARYLASLNVEARYMEYTTAEYYHSESFKTLVEDVCDIIARV